MEAYGSLRRCSGESWLPIEVHGMLNKKQANWLLALPRKKVELLKANPYHHLYADTHTMEWPLPELLATRPKYTFKIADGIYCDPELGKGEHNDPLRVNHAIYAVLHGIASSGDRHSCATEGQVMKQLSNAPYNIKDRRLVRSVLDSHEDLSIIDQDGRYVMKAVHEAEQDIALGLQQIEGNRVEYGGDVPDGLQDDDYQKELFMKCMEGGVTIGTGCGGTGKSEVARHVAERARSEPLRDNIRFCPSNIPSCSLCNGGLHGVHIAAPTGVAAKNMTERVSWIRATTIHAMLHNKVLKVHLLQNLHTLIVDEMSMVDVMLFARLIRKVKGVVRRLVLLGDFRQLRSVQHGQVLLDLIHSKALPHVELVNNYRTGGLRDATNILNDLGRQGTVPTCIPGVIDIIDADDTDSLRLGGSSNGIVRRLKQVRDQFLSLPPEVRQSHFQILACTNESRIILQTWVQTQQMHDSVPAVFKEGDEVLVHVSKQNNLRGVIKNVSIIDLEETDDFFKYEYQVETASGLQTIQRYCLQPYNFQEGDLILLNTNTKDYVNGDMGSYIRQAEWSDLSEQERQLRGPEYLRPRHVVKLNDGNYVIVPQDHIEFSYAMTVHNYQGRQKRVIFFVLEWGSREMLYTGMSRFTERVVVFNRGSLLQEMAARSEDNRHTRLSELME